MTADSGEAVETSQQELAATRLANVLADLAAVGNDHRTVEAKKAKASLPQGIIPTLSAFANTDGGLILLGVNEGPDGAFEVTGVGDPKRVSDALQSALELMEPPLRIQINTVVHQGKAVIMADVTPVPRDQRPCHVANEGELASSYVRVGDADQKMQPGEVAAMLANRKQVDTGIEPAPDAAEMDPNAAQTFVARVRENTGRYDGVAENEVLRDYSVVLRDDPTHLTWAGMLTLGRNPEAFSAAARVSYMRLPRTGDPEGTRHAASKLEGPLGQLLDDVLGVLARDLDHVQVSQDGDLIEEFDVPREALREIVSNALVHRSFVNGARDQSVVVHLSDTEVVVMSPGGLPPAVDIAGLGLGSIATARNNTLVRIAEKLATPAGVRIVEHQAVGIAHADRICHRRGTMPALFIETPNQFTAVLLRRALDTAEARSILKAARVDPDPAYVRLISVLMRLEQTRQDVVSTLGPTAFDSLFCARALAPCTPDDAATRLNELERAGVLRRNHLRTRPAWVFAQSQTPSATGTSGSGSIERRILELLRAR